MDLFISSDYCRQCGNLLDFSQPSEFITCLKCNHKSHLSQFVDIPNISTIQFKGKAWLRGEQYVQKVQKNIIDEVCTRCGNDKMYYWTMQIRSADQGSTVFYKCPKCQFTFNQNN